MTPYWERRIDGRRFSEWVAFIGGLVVFGLNLLKFLRPHPLDGWDYFQISAWGFVTLVCGFRLFRARRRLAP